MLKKGSNNPSNMSLVEVGTHKFVFGFQDHDNPRKILEKASQNVLGFLVYLKWWDSQMTIDELNFICFPYWVQVHGLLIDFLNVKNARITRERLGEV